ncbi:MAG: cohesin domain-containing protein [Melioribacteraceae bacterium]|nr:cohesin domain-containing protein [Melioribacteraceae bacterium]MCF8352799.1 cohesin domain-containing protein [Melioribacteraceae bacterium]MCF8393481.1 cohesin domain-containing protein [Melioribacteraceae bacterium]MCF8417316.1 cohesin domain-containing protein [Melioribacteraceae bacterium]
MKSFQIYSRHKLIFAIILFTISIGLFSACQTSQSVENPPPFLKITDGPAENTVLSEDVVSFVWKGSDNSFFYKYRLLAIDEDNFPSTYIDWNDYSKENEVTFYNLDESKFRFEVMGISNGLEGGPERRNFEINAVTGPTLTFYKTETNISLGGKDSVNIWLEDLDSLKAIRVVVAFDPNYVNLVSISGGDLVKKQRFEQIIVPDYNDTTVVNSVNATGKLELNSAVLATLGSLPQKSLSGSGSVLNVSFRGMKIGTTNLEFVLIEMHKENGAIISGKTPKSGIINIK